MKLYLGGKMLGIPEFGFEFFDDAAVILRSLGHEVFSPAEHDRANGFDPKGMAGTYADMNSNGFNRRAALAADMAWIAEHSEGMVAIENWPDSPGAKAEITFHHALYLPVWELNEFIRFGVVAPRIPPLVTAPRVIHRAERYRLEFR